MTRKPPAPGAHPPIGGDDDEPTRSSTSTASRARRAVAHIAGEQLRQMLHRAPTVVTSGAVTKLPEVEPPRLDDISVTVPAPSPITAEQILARFYDLRREHAEVTERAEGEPVQAGDEVRVDIVGYHARKVLPFSVRTDLWMTLEDNPELPGLTQGLVGTPVGGSRTVQVKLPASYPVEALRGELCVFAVTIHEAAGVRLPDEKDPAFLEATGLGHTLEEVMDAITRQLADELADRLLEEGRQLVLDEVGLRAKMELPDSLIDEEIRRRWHEVEGRHLAAMGVSFDDQDDALEAWKRDPGTRAEVERSLRVSLALGAIAKRDGVAVDKDAIESFLEGLSEGGGVPMGELVDALQKDVGLQRLLSDKLLHLLTVEHVMQLVEVRFEGAD